MEQNTEQHEKKQGSRLRIQELTRVLLDEMKGVWLDLYESMCLAFGIIVQPEAGGGRRFITMRVTEGSSSRGSKR